MAFTPLTFSKSWKESRDFPTYEPDETQVRADLQLLHDETRDSLNGLIGQLNGPEAAANLPIRAIRGLSAACVQDALAELLDATEQAASGQILDGTVGKTKLTAALLERIYGGRVWVSMAEPGPAQNPAADFPVGQLWLRPFYRIPNLAGKAWSVTGGRAETLSDGWRLVSDGSSTTVTASQQLERLGQAGDRILVYCRTTGVSAHFAAVSLYLNGLEQELGDGGVFETALEADGGLELALSAQAPYEEAGLQLELRDLAIINPDSLERSLPDAHRDLDWAALLREKSPFYTVEQERALFVQQEAGVWKRLTYQVLPTACGGTGLADVKAGQLLYGGSTGALQTLEPPGQPSMLWFDGSPRWKDREQAIGTLGMLRAAAGTYAGNSAPRTLELPVKPRLLLVYCKTGPRYSNAYNGQQDASAVLTDGSAAIQSGYADMYYSTQVRLRGSKLEFLRHTSSGPDFLCNTKGYEYGWIALY